MHIQVQAHKRIKDKIENNQGSPISTPINRASASIRFIRQRSCTARPTQPPGGETNPTEQVGNEKFGGWGGGSQCSPVELLEGEAAGVVVVDLADGVVELPPRLVEELGVGLDLVPEGLDLRPAALLLAVHHLAPLPRGLRRRRLLGAGLPARWWWGGG